MNGSAGTSAAAVAGVKVEERAKGAAPIPLAKVNVNPRPTSTMAAALSPMPLPMPIPMPTPMPMPPAQTVPPPHPSAMRLFAPGPNDGCENLQQVDLDELFHDCYFGEFAIPDVAASSGGHPAHIPLMAATNANANANANAAGPIAAALGSAVPPPRLQIQNQTQTPTPAAPGKRTASEAGLTDPPAAAAYPGAPHPPATLSSIFSALSKGAGRGGDPGEGLEHEGEGEGIAGGGSKPPTHELSESQKIERRERNREHAKRSRLRKKFLLESLQEQIQGLQSEIDTLKGIVRTELPEKADELLRGIVGGGAFGTGEGGDGTGEAGGVQGSFTPLPMPSGFGPVKTLMEPDYRLMSALSGSQQNFAISDPSLPDNPIVYVSGGFLELTGYTLGQVLGRNCRFLQGPGTDQAAVDVIRRGVSEGTDTSVCLLNYKADGTPFWNQFFVAALRDAENNVVNFVGVQCEVSKAVVEKHIKEGKTPGPTTNNTNTASTMNTTSIAGTTSSV